MPLFSRHSLMLSPLLPLNAIINNTPCDAISTINIITRIPHAATIIFLSTFSLSLMLFIFVRRYSAMFLSRTCRCLPDDFAFDVDARCAMSSGATRKVLIRSRAGHAAQILFCTQPACTACYDCLMFAQCKCASVLHVRSACFALRLF